MRAPNTSVLLSDDVDSPFHDVGDHYLLRGSEAGDEPPRLLIEVPHGADRFAHYQNLRQRLQGTLPDQLEHFFFVNTDVGAWQLGVAAAQQLVARDPTLAIELVRCRIPRTFVDTNRVPGGGGDRDLSKGGMTPGMAPYIDHEADRALLTDLHGRYLDAVEARMADVVARDGFAFLPHTYGPVTMGIDRVDEAIVEKLHWALAPERAESWPIRPEVDVIHADADGTSYAPDGVLEVLRQGYAALDLPMAENDTYRLHPSTMGMVWSQRFRGRVLSLEVRRDLLVERWTPFAEMDVRDAASDRFAGPIVEAFASLLGR